VGRVLSQLKEIFDVVIVDSAPLLGVGDSLALIPRMDAVIVVTRLELLRRPVLDELHRVLEGSPAKPLGFVVTAAEREGGEAYGYGYGYGHVAHGSAYAPSTNGRAVVPSGAPANPGSRSDDA
jgi:Mrp family chromosome partitioning ATPase